MSRRYGSGDDGVDDVDFEYVPHPNAETAMKFYVKEFISTKTEKGRLFANHLWRYIITTPTIHHPQSKSISVKIEIPSSIESEFAKNILKDVFEDEDFADYAVGEGDEVKIEDIYKYPEIDEIKFSLTKKIEKMTLYHIVYSTKLEYRIPILNAIYQAISERNIQDITYIDYLRSPDDFFPKTKYMIKGLNIACPERAIDYDVVDAMVEEWGRVLDLYNNLISKTPLTIAPPPRPPPQPIVAPKTTSYEDLKTPRNMLKPREKSLREEIMGELKDLFSKRKR